MLLPQGRRCRSGGKVVVLDISGPMEDWAAHAEREPSTQILASGESDQSKLIEEGRRKEAGASEAGLRASGKTGIEKGRWNPEFPAGCNPIGPEIRLNHEEG